MQLLELPNEVLLQILKFCSYRTISNLSKTCKALRDISNLDIVWRHQCKKDYDVIEKGESFSSYSKLYKKFLHKYGHLIGTYMLNIHIYGGLAEIEFQNGITVWHWKQILNLPEKPLKKLKIFRIEKSEGEDEAKVICYGCKDHHDGLLQESKKRRYVFKCGKPDLHCHEECSENFVYDIFYHTSLIDGMQMLPVKIHDSSDVPRSLLMEDESLPPSLIEPGLFRGVFDSVEDNFIIFDYKSEGTLFGFRAATDNFACAEKSVKVLLRRSFVPTPEFLKNSHQSLILIPDGMYENIHPKNITEQDFQVFPVYGICDHYKPLLKKCKSRFHGFGKVFGGGFHEIHFVVFNNDRIGILWLELANFRLFERVKRKFSDKKGSYAGYINN